MTDNGKRVVCEVLIDCAVYVFDDNGQETTWNNAYRERQATGRTYKVQRVKRPGKSVLMNNLVFAVK